MILWCNITLSLCLPPQNVSFCVDNALVYRIQVDNGLVYRKQVDNALVYRIQVDHA